jgi:hypothetical protein
MLDARLKVESLSFSGRGSSGVSPMLARPWEYINSRLEDAGRYSPVNAASNIGYWNVMSVLLRFENKRRLTRSEPTFPTSWAYFRRSALFSGLAGAIKANQSLL